MLPDATSNDPPLVFIDMSTVGGMSFFFFLSFFVFLRSLSFFEDFFPEPPGSRSTA